LVCPGGVHHSVVPGGMGRNSPRLGSAGGALDDWLRANLGHGKQCGVGPGRDPVCSLGTGERSRLHYLVARSLASDGQLTREAESERPRYERPSVTSGATRCLGGVPSNLFAWLRNALPTSRNSSGVLK